MTAIRVALKLIFINSIMGLCLGMCDQRPYGGILTCCDKKDSNCFVRVHNNRTRGQENTICYCDSYCKFTNDCCQDIAVVKKLCQKKSRDCKVSNWQKWGTCSRKCGLGIMKRTRKVVQFPLNGGKSCPSLRQTRGCNLNTVCRKNYHTAIVLPINFRREKFGNYGYENILPAVKNPDQENNNLPTFKSEPTYSYCVHYKVTYKRKSCRNTWASGLKSHIPVCVECQSRVMNGGHCRGEGAIGIRTRWKAFGLNRCHGDWIRLGEILPNCTCGEEQFSNFVFV